jgi:hypothetical protein
MSPWIQYIQKRAKIEKSGLSQSTNTWDKYLTHDKNSTILIPSVMRAIALKVVVRVLQPGLFLVLLLLELKIIVDVPLCRRVNYESWKWRFT